MYSSLAFLAAITFPLIGMIPLIRKSITPYRVVLEGMIVGIVGAIVFIILGEVSGQGVYEEMRESMDDMIKYLADDASFAQAMQISEMDETEQMAYLEKLFQASIDIFPSTIGILAAIAAYFEYILGSKLIKTKDAMGGEIKAIPMPPFREFSLPKSIIIGWVSVGVLIWIFTKTGMIENDVSQMNISTLFSFAFCLQGISVIFMYCYNKKVPKAIAIIIILFLLFLGFGQLALFILGMIDLIVSLKARMK